MLSRSAGARNVCLSGREEGIDSYSGPLAASAPTSLRPNRILTVSLQNFNPPSSDVLFSKRYQEERERERFLECVACLLAQRFFLPWGLESDFLTA